MSRTRALDEAACRSRLRPVALAFALLTGGAAPGLAQAIDNLLAPSPAPGAAAPAATAPGAPVQQRVAPAPRSANPPPRQERQPAAAPAAGQPAIAEPESYWSISIGPKTITLGYGVEPGSEQAAIRLVCSPRDSFIALNMSRGANPQMLERIRRIAGSEIPVTLQIERARFTARGPVVEADDPALPITVVLRSSMDDPALAAIRQGKRLRVIWQPGGQQGGFETPLENFAELEAEWQDRCARLAATEAPIGSEAAPPPVRSTPAAAPVDPAPAIAAPSFSAPSFSAPAGSEVFRPGDTDMPRPPANVPSRLPPQEPPTVIDR